VREFICTYWLEVIFSLVISGLSFALSLVVASVKKKSKEQDAVKEGVVAILHDRLFQSGMYFINKGEIGLSELRNIERMYEAYHNLGGNGTGTEVYERVRELRIVK